MARRIAHVAAILQDHFGSLARDTGFRSTFRKGHDYDQSNNHFSREDVMDEEWRARMRKHARVDRVLAKIEPEERATLYHAFSTERWPEPLQTVFWYHAVNGCIAGVVMAHPETIAAAGSKSKSPGAWLRRIIRTQVMRPQLVYLLKQAERETRIALESFEDAWKEDQT
jgi:hypothetical protein